MNGDISESTTGSAATALFVPVCIAVWVAAAASSGTLGIWLAIGPAAVGLGGAVLVLDRAGSMSVLRPRGSLVLMGAAAGGLMAAATHLLYPLLVSMAPFVAGDTVFLYSAFRAPPPAVASFVLVPVIFGEELVWRGVVQSAFVRRLGPRGGVMVASVIYALAHAPIGSPVLVLAAFVCGVSWGTLRAASGSLVPSLMSHIIWDVVVLLWLPLE